MNHIIHDVDRDGWGSAALVVAEVRPENCRLYPVRDKEIFAVLRGIEAANGDTIWILDIPGPQTWTAFPIHHGVRTIWVDHHLYSWSQETRPDIEIILPESTKPTTTMSMLVAKKLVSIVGAMDFVRAICARGQQSEWGIAFDGLASLAPHFPVAIVDLPKLLAPALHGESVPKSLQPAIDFARNQSITVERVSLKSKCDIGEYAVVAYIDDAHGVPLRHYSLKVASQHPHKVVVLVHRATLLYCGRDSGTHGIDLFRHFQRRGLKPHGHGYVCFVNITSEQVQMELDALTLALKQQQWLKDTISSAKQIREKLQPLIDKHGGRVHFRPSTGGVSMIGLLHRAPQLGVSGLSPDAIAKDFESLFERHCNGRAPDRDTGEKELQSFLIRDAYANHRNMASVNAASQGTTSPTELVFVTDEIALPTSATGKIVCDIMALRRISSGVVVPVLMELKNTRSMSRLIQQVDDYSKLIDAHADLFAQLYSALLGERVQFGGMTEKWIVWPDSGRDTEPREAELADKRIRAVCYRQDGERFTFRVEACPLSSLKRM